MNKGYVYLVGAGPGDIGLITVKGLECIQRADVIVYDRLANPRLLSYARPDAKYIYVGKTPDHHTLKQEEINEVLVEEALQGQVVTRLKGGDPYVKQTCRLKWCRGSPRRSLCHRMRGFR